MKYFGIHIGHDASLVAISKDGTIEFAAHAERLETRKKMNGDIRPIFKKFPGITITEKDCVSIIANGSLRGEKIKFLDPNVAISSKEEITINKQKIKINKIIDHHCAHAVSSWCFRHNENQRMFMAYDGSGPSISGPYKSSVIGEIGPLGISTYKDKNLSIPSSLPLFSLLGFNSAGKAMGLAGCYPDVDKIDWNDENVMKLIEMSQDKNDEYKPIRPTIYNEEDYKFAASFYKFITSQIWKSIEKILDIKKPKGVVLSGGTALALEINTKIHEKVGDVVFGPPVNDSGLALGAAALSFFIDNRFWPKIESASLLDLQEDLPKVGPQSKIEIANILNNGKVVAILRGKAEIGPRSLGFRSLFSQAKSELDLINVSQKIKGREFYRPLAPIVTTEQFERFFEGPKGKYMQFKVTCKDEAKNLLPAIVHKDGSARPQVVDKNDDAWLHSLLVEYGKLSGCECLINTSLNGSNRPICNTYEDAILDLADKNVVIVSLPFIKSNYANPIKSKTIL